MGRIFFTVHDGDSLLVSQFKQLVDSLDEPGALHHLWIIDLMQVVTGFDWDGMMFITARVARPTAQLCARIDY